jgi:nucleotide-binding universal stress UspA family protein
MFENVVVGATDSEGAARAVRSALEVARLSGGTLHLVMATRRSRLVTVALDRRTQDAGLDPTESLVAEFERMASRQSVRVQTHPLFSDPVDGITKVAAAEDADLIVVGSASAHGGRRLSAIPKAVMDIADCAVLVV